MAKVKATRKSSKKSRTRKYDLKGANPRKALTRAQKAHFDESMRLTNNSASADTMDFEKASKSVVAKMEERYS
jgi:hypothetical protein